MCPSDKREPFLSANKTGLLVWRRRGCSIRAHSSGLGLIAPAPALKTEPECELLRSLSHSLAGGRRLALGGLAGAAPCLGLALGRVADPLCVPPAVTVASSEQNPILIIAVVAIAGLTVLVSMVIGVMVWRR